MNLKLEEKSSHVSPQAPMHVLENTPFGVQLGENVASHLSPSINYDLLLDCVRAHPEYKSYFSEKITKVARLEDKILKPELRGYGETKTYLKQWKMRFIKQINFMINYLGRKNNGN